MQTHVRDLKHIARAQAVPRVHHAVVAEGNRDPGRQQLRNASHAAPLRIAVVAALQGDVDERVGNRRHARLGD